MSRVSLDFGRGASDCVLDYPPGDEFWGQKETATLALNTTVAEIRSSTFHEMLAQGRASLTTGINEAWYFDHGISNPRFIQDDWEPYYLHDPFEGLSETQLKANLGGEVDSECVLLKV